MCLLNKQIFSRLSMILILLRKNFSIENMFDNIIGCLPQTLQSAPTGFNFAYFPHLLFDQS